MKLDRTFALAAGIAALALGPQYASAEDQYESGATVKCPEPGDQAAAEALPPECEEILRQQQQPVRGTEEYMAPEEQQPVRGEQPGDVDVDVDVDTAQPMPQRQPMPRQPYMTQQPYAQPQPVRVVEEEEEGPLLTPFGLGISVGGGIVDFNDDSLDTITDIGGAWDARLVVGTRSPVALEAAYIGTAQDVSALGLDDDAVLVSNGAEGLLRLNLISDYPVSPFIFGGAAWQRYDIVNESFNTSNVANDDDIFAIPFGGGVAATYRGLLLDARFTWRETFEEDLLRTPTGSTDEDQDLANWGVTGRVGFEF